LAIVMGAAAGAQRASAYIYWANQASPGSIGRANPDGSGVNLNFIPAGGTPAGVAVGGSHIYWSGGNANSEISRANLDGSDIDESFITGLANQWVAVDSTHIYWDDHGVPGAAGNANTFGRANLDGSGVNRNYFEPDDTGTGAPTVDGTHIYWTTGINEIGRANLDGSPAGSGPSCQVPGIVASGYCFISLSGELAGATAVDGAHIYWTTGNNEIGRANLDGTGIDEHFITTDNTEPTALAVDGAHIYWTASIIGTGGGGVIGRANLDGSGVQPTFITGLTDPDGIAVDGGCCSAGGGGSGGGSGGSGGSASPPNCSRIGPKTPGVVGKSLKSLGDKNLEFSVFRSSQVPAVFEIYGAAGLNEPSFCETNIALQNVLLWTVDQPYLSVIAKPSIEATPPQRTFWYSPSKGWQRNKPKVADWTLAPKTQVFSIDWHSAKITVKPAEFDANLDNQNVVVDLSPLISFQGPTLMTRLIDGTVKAQRVYLEGDVTPGAFIGARLSFALPKASCAAQMMQMTNQLGFGAPIVPIVNGLSAQSLAAIMASDVEKTALSTLVDGFASVLGGIPGAVVASDQVKSAIGTIVQAYFRACFEGASNAATEELAVVLAAPAAILGSEAAGTWIATQAGRLVLIPAAKWVLATASVADAGRFVSGSALQDLAARDSGARGVSRIGPPPPSSVARFAARRATLDRRLLRRAPLPNQLLSAIREVQILPTAVRVGHLLMSGTLRPGHWITAVAGRFPSLRRHRAIALLLGPGYMGARLLSESHGVAAASIKLPTRMRPGLWTIAVTDSGNLRFSGGQLGGTSDIRITTFSLAQHRHPH